VRGSVKPLALAWLLAAAIVPAGHAKADDSSTQQIVVTAPSSSSTSGTLTAYQQSGGVWHAVY